MQLKDMVDSILNLNEDLKSIDQIRFSHHPPQKVVELPNDPKERDEE